MGEKHRHRTPSYRRRVEVRVTRILASAAVEVPAGLRPSRIGYIE